MHHHLSRSRLVFCWRSPFLRLDTPLMPGGRHTVVALAGVAALVAAVNAYAGTPRSGRAPVWRVTQFSFAYSQTADNPQACSEATVSGTEVARETVRLDVGKLKRVQPIDYQYTPGLKAKPGGPDSRGHSLLAIGETVERTVTKDIVDCETGEHSTVTCNEPVHGPLSAYSTGAYSLWTVRKKSVVKVEFRLMGDEFEQLLSCRADPGGSLGASFLEGATHDTYVVRTTAPLRSFARPTTTVSLSRTLPAPADAAGRGLPTGTATVEANIVLRKGLSASYACPAKDPLFHC
jgi:hypothetical protein